MVLRVNGNVYASEHPRQKEAREFAKKLLEKVAKSYPNKTFTPVLYRAKRLH